MNSSKYNIQVEVVARPDAIDNGDGKYALDVAIRMIEFFTEYFNVSYPMTKSSNFYINFKFHLKDHNVSIINIIKIF